MLVNSFDHTPAKNRSIIPLVKCHIWALVLYRRKFSNMFVITGPLKGPVIHLTTGYTQHLRYP
jgi:hypothetical protein